MNKLFTGEFIYYSLESVTDPNEVSEMMQFCQVSVSVSAKIV